MVQETPHLREKTARIGVIARILAVFRVEYVTIYKDTPSMNGREVDLVSTLFRYAATPQYLRRKAFGLSPILQFAGILPPLRTPNHQLSSKLAELPRVSYREGIVLSASGKECSIDVGLPNPVTINRTGARPGEILIIRVRKNGNLAGEVVNHEEISHYFGVRSIAVSDSLRKALAGSFDARIATSRTGTPMNQITDQLSKFLKGSERTLILFGSPQEGLHDIAAREGFNLDTKVDFTVNTVPDQGTATVRTEEALSASLSILNFLIHQN